MYPHVIISYLQTSPHLFLLATQFSSSSVSPALVTRCSSSLFILSLFMSPSLLSISSLLSLPLSTHSLYIYLLYPLASFSLPFIHLTNNFWAGSALPQQVRFTYGTQQQKHKVPASVDCKQHHRECFLQYAPVFLLSPSNLPVISLCLNKYLHTQK